MDLQWMCVTKKMDWTHRKNDDCMYIVAGNLVQFTSDWMYGEHIYTLMELYKPRGPFWEEHAKYQLMNSTDAKFHIQNKKIGWTNFPILCRLLLKKPLKAFSPTLNPKKLVSGQATSSDSLKKWPVTGSAPGQRSPWIQGTNPKAGEGYRLVKDI